MPKPSKTPESTETTESCSEPFSSPTSSLKELAKKVIISTFEPKVIEEVFENIIGMPISKVRPFKRRPISPILIITLPLLRVTKYLIRLVDFFKFLSSFFFVVGVLVRVPPDSQFSIALLDLLGGAGFGELEDLVVASLLFGHGFRIEVIINVGDGRRNRMFQNVLERRWGS